jgi:hypothetical protein
VHVNVVRLARVEAQMLPHLSAACTLARYLLRDAAAADDAVQEACLLAVRRFETFRGENAVNAVIMALRCGAMVGSNGVTELRALPAGRHMLQVRAVGFPPESVEVAAAQGETVRMTVQLRKAAAVPADTLPPATPRR